MNHIKKLLSPIIILLLLTQACKINYSFSGAEITAKTISINFIENKAQLVQPTLSQVFTDELRDKFVNQTSLELVDRNGELHLEGEITDYSIRTAAIQGNETAAMNRMTIRVNMRFVNAMDEKASFETTFSSFEDFASDENLTDVEDDLLALISKRIVEEVFNKAVVNW